MTVTETHDIDAILVDEVATARLLRDALHCERDSLAANQVDQLEALAQQKQGLAERLEGLAARRSSGLAGNNVTTGFDNWVSNQPVLKKNWQTLLDLLDECRQLNRTNGRVVEQLQRRTRNTLALLQGQTGIQELYGPSGKTEATGGSQILSRA